MKFYKEKMENNHGYLSGAADCIDDFIASKAIDYKKNITKLYMALPPELIDQKLGGTEFFVTRKYDGELNLIFYENGTAILVNRSGKVKVGLPCSEESAKILEKAGIKQTIIPAELYVDEENGRTRVFEVLNALADKELINKLRLAPFDIVEIDGSYPKVKSFGEINDKLTDIFGKSSMCRPARCQKASSKNDVKTLYTKWVDEEGAEGLVVRTESPMVYKIKPRFNVDVAVVGFSEGTGDTKGQVRTLLIAMMTEEGKYQVVGRTGNGMSDEYRKELYERLMPTVIDSYYIETDSNHVAFYMVKPEQVIEIMINDVLFESTSGSMVNPILEIRDNAYYRRGECEGVSFVYPIMVRERGDKTVCVEDVRLDQLLAFVSLPEQKEGGLTNEMPKSEIIHREVYKKIAGTKLMIQKYVVWKTNKEKYDDYYAYVLHYTDFSSERKEPLKREIRVSNDKDQILELFKKMVEENVKKGWIQV